MVLGSKEFDLHWLTDQVIIHLLPNVSLEGPAHDFDLS